MWSVNSTTEKENSVTGRTAQPVVSIRMPYTRSPMPTHSRQKSRKGRLSPAFFDTQPSQLQTCESPRQHSAGQDIINQYKQAVAHNNGRALVRMIQTNQRRLYVKRNTVRLRDYTAYKKYCVGNTSAAFVDTIYLTETTPTKPATPLGYKRPHRFALGRRSVMDFRTVT